MMAKLELAPQMIGELVAGQIRQKGFTPHLTINCSTRVSITIEWG
ncbi:hypothetical protein ES705_35848 [subsurface metagenome]